MIKFGAIVPHSPILVPSIGKENQGQLENTIKAYEKIKEELEAEEIETIIIVSSHGPIRPEIWSFNLGEVFEINFEEFGDFSDKLKLACDMELTQILKEGIANNDNLQLINYPVFDHGSGVPLFLLCYELKNIKIVSLYVSERNLTDQYRLGREIAKILAQDQRKTAFIASGDLSHCLNKKAPCGYSPKGAKFDQKLIECLKEKKTEEIISANEETLEEVKACGPRSIAVLLGALSGLEYETKILSYEYPFGIGNLTTIHKIISSAALQ